MAAICDMALGWSADRRYFLGIVRGGIKNRFHEKEGGQFLHTNGIYCVLLAINSSKQRKDNLSRTLPMVSSKCVSRYCDLFTTETIKLSFFHQLSR